MNTSNTRHKEWSVGAQTFTGCRAYNILSFRSNYGGMGGGGGLARGGEGRGKGGGVVEGGGRGAGGMGGGGGGIV